MQKEVHPRLESTASPDARTTSVLATILRTTCDEAVIWPIFESTKYFGKKNDVTRGFIFLWSTVWALLHWLSPKWAQPLRETPVAWRTKSWRPASRCHGPRSGVQRDPQNVEGLAGQNPGTGLQSWDMWTRIWKVPSSSPPQFVLFSLQIGLVFLFFFLLGGGEREAGAFVHSCKFGLGWVG
jgi:hypothetical protein